MTNASTLLDNLVPISAFNHGGASKAFAQVTRNNPVVVLKNNSPVAIIISPDDYKRLTEAAEDLILHQGSAVRLSASSHTLTEEEAFKNAPLVEDGYEPEFD